MMILESMASDGIHLKHVATTHGGEYAGACPWCGGYDRFRVWPKMDRYWCRQCRRAGDSIQFLRHFRGMSYKAACEILGVIPRVTAGNHRSPNHIKWEPRQTREPAERWRDKATAFLKWTQGRLLGTGGSGISDWLRNVRGLSEESIKKAGLGWNPKNWWRDRERWGLEEVLNDDDKPKQLWLPRGLVIPYQPDGRLMRLRVRRPQSDDGPRYYLIPGSDTRSMILNCNPETVVILESELDVILVSQEARNLVTAIALGNASSRPDQDTHGLLCRANRILVSLDADDAGAKEAWRWWPQHYPGVKRWPCVFGKDPGEMWKAGVNIRCWIEAALTE